MHHLVLPRLAGRAQLRRHAVKLQHWCRGESQVADLDCVPLPVGGLYALELGDGYGLSNDGFRVVFCEVPNPGAEETICVLAVLRADEALTTATLEILWGRACIARERVPADPEL